METSSQQEDTSHEGVFEQFLADLQKLKGVRQGIINEYLEALRLKKIERLKKYLDV